MHQVLKIDHILERTFRYCNESVQRRSAFVCKNWLNPALNAYWHDVERPGCLFYLLKKIHDEEDEADDDDRDGSPLLYYFENLPDDKDWLRFEKVSRRVRYLLIADEYEFISRAQHILIDVLFTRPGQILLPNLTTLVVECEAHHMKAAMLFLHSRLSRLELIFSGSEKFVKEDSISSFFNLIVSKAPNIAELVIETKGFDFGFLEIEHLIVHLIPGLKSLQKLTLPYYSLTPTTFQTLALLPDLKIIETDCDLCKLSRIEEIKNGVLEFQATLNSGAFTSLRSLSLQISLSDATLLLGLDNFPMKLHRLSIQTLLIESGTTCQIFLESVVNNCQSLVELVVDMREQYSDADFDPLSFVNIEPILQSRTLKNLSLMHVHPLLINNTGITILARKLPHLETLILNPEPWVDGESSITLDVLVSLAVYCPNLRTLGLYINANQMVNIPTDFVPSKLLGTLSFGASSISDEMLFESQLKQLCPPSCTVVDSLVPWPDKLADSLKNQN